MKRTLESSSATTPSLTAAFMLAPHALRLAVRCRHDLDRRHERVPRPRPGRRPFPPAIVPTGRRAGRAGSPGHAAPGRGRSRCEARVTIPRAGPARGDPASHPVLAAGLGEEGQRVVEALRPGRCPPTASGSARRRSRSPPRRSPRSSPIPPTVAAKSSASRPRVNSHRSPEAVRAHSAVTCLPNVPAAAWFLPWISAAMAPPTVTCWVPGTTGRTQPSARQRRQQAAQRHPGLRPHRGRSYDRLESVETRGVHHHPSVALSRVAIAAAHAPRDRAAREAARPDVRAGTTSPTAPTSPAQDEQPPPTRRRPSRSPPRTRLVGGGPGGGAALSQRH